MLKICPKCSNVVSYNSYFSSYLCNKCGCEFDEPEAEKEIITVPDSVLDEIGFKTGDKVEFIVDKENKEIRVKIV